MSILEKINSPKDLKKLTTDRLNELCGEIRKLILDTVFTRGGHLSSNLGAVEAVVALHYVFDAPKDKIIFDVGHQCYAHKILTGRREMFSTLRSENGISGFPKSAESEFDVADTGHASTSISLACGLARACNDGEQIVSFIGDGAMTGGLAYEALNDLACMGKKMIIVLNDNEMSISRNVGLISSYLERLRREKVARPFALFGLKYIGVIDGHDVKSLIKAFRKAKKSDEAVIVHILTKKGKGYKDAERDPEKYHGYSVSEQKNPTFSQIAGEKLCDLAAKDPDVYAVTAAMASGTGLDIFEKKFPERFIDVGIAEAHAACMSAGMALGGKKPYFAVYSTFLQRAYDQLVHDVCLNALPVTFCIDRCGVVAGDGETHQGVFDISFMRALPEMTVFSPKDGEELKAALDWSLSYGKPLAIRYPKAEDGNSYGVHEPIVLGKWEKLTDRNADAVILATGAVCVANAIKASEILAKQGIVTDVINARFVKPMDEDMLDEISDKAIFTVEDGVKTGGFGEGVIAYYAEKGIAADVTPIAFDEKPYPQGSTDYILRVTSTDAAGIADKVSEKIKK